MNYIRLLLGDAKQAMKGNKALFSLRILREFLVDLLTGVIYPKKERLQRDVKSKSNVTNQFGEMSLCENEVGDRCWAWCPR